MARKNEDMTALAESAPAEAMGLKTSDWPKEKVSHLHRVLRQFP